MAKIIRIRGKNSDEIEKKADAIVKEKYGPRIEKRFDYDTASTQWNDEISQVRLAELIIGGNGGHYLCLWYSKREAEKRRREVLSRVKEQQ